MAERFMQNSPNTYNNFYHSQKESSGSPTPTKSTATTTTANTSLRHSKSNLASPNSLSSHEVNDTSHSSSNYVGDTVIVESKSQISGGGRSRGSSVLARAREYNRIIDKNKSISKSFDGSASRSFESTSRSFDRSPIAENVSEDRSRATSNSRVRRSSPSSKSRSSPTLDYQRGANLNTSHTTAYSTQSSHSIRSQNRDTSLPTSAPSPSSMQQTPVHLPNNSPRSSPIMMSRERSHSQHSRGNLSINNSGQHQDDRASSYKSHHQQQLPSPHSFDSYNSETRSNKSYNGRHREKHHRKKEKYHDIPDTHERQDKEQQQQQQHEEDQQQSPAIVTPELLVDALSGTEDGLLNIAERLMEYYDSGYDAMGEAIIDAFADVQKLFQHVVEAAHMEGAAYEAGRNNEEIERLRKMVENSNGGVGASIDEANEGPSSPTGSNGGPIRHDEFIDEDVRDVLLEAVRKGHALKEANKLSECFQVYEEACNNASSLLPVDSDHRGRLQLSIARADSMSPERACAILKYVMDDVLRSGLNSNSKVTLPDPSTRGDCVLARPTPKSARSSFGDGRSSPLDRNQSSNDFGVDAVLQSSEEALASLVEEMKDILGAPVYNNSPLVNVSERFWKALADSQKTNTKNEERLEQNLASLKADFLLAREEWEEKYNEMVRECQSHKKKSERLKQTIYMEQAQKGLSNLDGNYDSDDNHAMNGSRSSGLTNGSPKSKAPGSVTSLASLSHHAQSFVRTFSCSGGGDMSNAGSMGSSSRRGRRERDMAALRSRQTSSRSRGSSGYSKFSIAQKESSEADNFSRGSNSRRPQSRF